MRTRYKSSKERDGAKLIDANWSNSELIIEGWRVVICISAAGMSPSTEAASDHNKHVLRYLIKIGNEIQNLSLDPAIRALPKGEAGKVSNLPHGDVERRRRLQSVDIESHMAQCRGKLHLFCSTRDTYTGIP